MNASKGVFEFERGVFGALSVGSLMPTLPGTSCLVRLYSPLERGKAPRLLTVRPSSERGPPRIRQRTRAWPTAEPASIVSTALTR